MKRTKQQKLIDYINRLEYNPPDNRLKPLALRGATTTKENNSFIITQIKYNG